MTAAVAWVKLLLRYTRSELNRMASWMLSFIDRTLCRMRLTCMPKEGKGGGGLRRGHCIQLHAIHPLRSFPPSLGYSRKESQG